MRLALTSCIALAAAVAKVSAGCWAQSQGYKCCSNPSNTKVEYTDTSGNWGIENDDWCGIDYSYNANSGNNQCTGNGAYRCCNGCETVYTDNDGNWGFENNDWCGIKYTCGNQQQQPQQNNQCTGNGAYKCCNSCNTTYTDNDGRWGFENNDWCGIKYSCPQQQQTTTTRRTTTTTTRQQQQTNTNTSGVPENPPDFSGQTGKTTRYWDCCLASCSWKENAKNCSAPVNACEKKDGVTKFTDFSNLWKYKSICDGGSIAMCNNQQPWAINDKVSYGFVASHEECCTCQRLKFTSGPVAGKQMIVQTTNTGGDLSQNHFDIQMPGGGFGIFDGCTSQWGLSSSNWGERYGGLKSASQCSGLPAELQKGCEWRFNWFQNADNPSVVFERVQCPKELTDITGCIRNDDSSQKKPW